jgi:chemotaxis signal transduction protein
VTTRDMAERAVELRATFDQAFARPLQEDAAATEDLVLLRVGGDACALRVRDLSGLASPKKVVPVPSHARHVVGVATLRGSLIAVYSLEGLLGYATAAPTTGKWLALSRRPNPVALAFDELDGFARVAHEAVSRSAGAMPAAFCELVRIGVTTRRVIDTESVLAIIGAGARGPTKEG